MEQEPKKPNIWAERLKKNNQLIKIGATLFLAIGVIGGLWYWYAISQRIYTDKAEISAPLIVIGPEQPDILREVLVKTGDTVNTNQALARFENGYARAKTDGIIVDTNNEIGKLFSTGTAVVTMIDPRELRVIAHVQENKGFGTIRAGQKVTFTVDAYNGKKYQGEVDEIANTADQTSVVFSISDKRITKEFSIKIKYDVGAYPELYNGMSAKVWIYR